MNLRNTPQIRFLLDQSTEYGVAMSRLIDEIAAKEGRAVIGETDEDFDDEELDEEEMDDISEEE